MGSVTGTRQSEQQDLVWRPHNMEGVRETLHLEQQAPRPRTDSMEGVRQTSPAQLEQQESRPSMEVEESQEYPLSAFDRKRYATLEDNPVIGIDLGTSYCKVAVFRNNIDDIEIVPNELGQTITPSCVAFSREDGCLVGDAAKKHGMKNPEECIFEVKCLMGRSYHDASVQQDKKKWPFHVSSGPNGGVVLDLPDAPGRPSFFRPEEISAFLLKKMKEIAEEFTGCRPIRDAVITVPACFNHSQRKATMAAGVGAGLNVLRLMSETTAAALAYGHQHLIRTGPAEKNVLVFDLGGGTFDVSIVTVKAGPDGDCSFVVKAVAGDSHLGGADIDQRLVQHVAEHFKKPLRGEDLLGEGSIPQKLNQAVVDAKHALSTTKDVIMADINLGYRDHVLSLKLGRLELEALSTDLFHKCMRLVERALGDAKVSKDEICDVVLVGGSTRIPKVQEMLTAFFGKPPISSVNPDEAVAFGAAVQAGLLARSHKCAEASISVQDVTSVSVGVDSRFDIMDVLIPRNSPLPAIGSTEYTLLDDEVSGTVGLYEGERALCAHNRFLGELTVDGFTPGPARMQNDVRVVLTIDANGILHAAAEMLAKHKDVGRKVETPFTLGTGVVTSLADGLDTRTDRYTLEAEDANIWAAKDSMLSLCSLILWLRAQLHSSKEDCHTDLELQLRLNEAWAWWDGHEELATKEEYDRRIAELEQYAGLD
ncbi:hypothetical protein CBR_g21200 [Chara braunii]|uniref:Uncharacterized protein n=1 Tax=Chara braunii TaxID=69332 RepID=A0A388L131_CHABU|nr:hypothetical protein CBR_g21200 [Chara braunii]|eukprot:GBG75958.1 hypothetical protein CBR_g21200 [Chara braunii]